MTQRPSTNHNSAVQPVHQEHVPAITREHLSTTLPWQPLDPLAQQWALLALRAQNAVAYQAAAYALLALSCEEHARLAYAALIGTYDTGRPVPLSAFQPIIEGIAEAWRNWQTVVVWMDQQSAHCIRLHPLEEVLPLVSSDTQTWNEEDAQTLLQSALTQQQRLATLFAHIGQASHMKAHVRGSHPHAQA